jgi:hypothetical protein
LSDAHSIESLIHAGIGCGSDLRTISKDVLREVLDQLFSDGLSFGVAHIDDWLLSIE